MPTPTCFYGCPRMAIGDVYTTTLAIGKGDGTFDYKPLFGQYWVIEICGEVYIDGDRYAIGVKQNDPDFAVVFDKFGNAYPPCGDRWRIARKSRAKPKFSRVPDREG